MWEDGRWSAASRYARKFYVPLAVAFVFCVLIQFLLSGLALFVHPEYWNMHKTFVHYFSLLPIVMILLSFIGRFPWSIRWLSIGLYALLVMQYVTVKLGMIAALHPVIALFLFWAAMSAIRRGNRLSRGSGKAGAPWIS